MPPTLKNNLYTILRLTLLLLILLFITRVSADEPVEAKTKQSLESIANAAKEIADKYHHMGWYSGSLLIAKDNKVFYEQSYGFANLSDKTKNSAATRFNLGSIMKNFTRVLVVQQLDDGHLTLDDTLEKFDLGFPPEVSSKVTIRHLLNHSAGFQDIFVAEYRENQLAFNTLDKKLQLLIDKPLLFEPGSDHKYSNYGYIVLGAILEKVSAMSFENLLEKNIFKPAGLTNTSFDVAPSDKNQSTRYSYYYDGSLREVGVTEHPSPDGGIESTAADVQKFYRELFYGVNLVNNTSPLVRKAFAMDGDHWGSYGGGPGVSAAAEINLVDGIEVIVLANTDHLVAELISGRIHSFIKTGDYDEVTDFASRYAYSFYEQHGKEHFYKEFKEQYKLSGYKQFIGRTINELGMQLIKSQAWNAAFDMINYLVVTFPNSPQVYDSLAFVYHSKGESTKAMTTFSKALALVPGYKSHYVSNNYGH
jgi:CubicO group peptidase (beta-lactamase class C family)